MNTSTSEDPPHAIEEFEASPPSGWIGLPVSLTLIVLFAVMIAVGIGRPLVLGPAIGLGIVSLLAGILGLVGLFAVQPGNARVLLLFGDYRGTVKRSGFFWVNPFYTRQRISLRVRNFETGSTTTPESKSAEGKIITAKGRTAGRASKVNDADGNPIEISAVVVWRVVDTAEAMFEVDDFEHFVEVQSEAALRSLASRYPYDSVDDDATSLRGDTGQISRRLAEDIQERLIRAGVSILEARISHLAYAPEIAAAMLQRQQAGAVVAARTRIVDGAVGMVDMALAHLKRDNIADLTDDQKAALVSNLLVVLCSDRHTQPVVQTGA